MNFGFESYVVNVENTFLNGTYICQNAKSGILSSLGKNNFNKSLVGLS